MITLRPLFFAFEDRMEITKLVIQTLPQLLTGSNVASSAKELWERIDAFMTDAGSKNLKVEVAKMLRLDHVLLQLLCKSHTCEKFDLTTIQTIENIEVIMGLWEIANQKSQLKPLSRLKSVLPQTQSFLLC